METQSLMDAVFVFVIGGLITGRFFDFALRPDFYEWSISRLVFFHIFGGFNFLGALLGGSVLLFIFQKKKKARFWTFLDFAASPVLFSIFSLNLFSFIFNYVIKNIFETRTLIFAFCFFIFFWIFKRFEKQKRHLGFFGSFLFAVIFFINLVFKLEETEVNGELVRSIDFWFVVLTLIATGVFWYFLSKRELKNDVKGLFGAILLSLFKFFRTITNVREANNVARSIIFFPLTLAKVGLNLLKLISLEIGHSMVDLLVTLGVKNARR